MKKIAVVQLLFIIITACCLFTCRQRTTATPEKQIAQTVLLQMDSFSSFITHTFLPAAQNKLTTKIQLQQLFLQARLLYKKFEWASEYFTPQAAKLINGAPVPSVEDGTVVTPQGLQVIESFLFPQYDTTNSTALQQQLSMLPESISESEAYFKNIPLLNWQVFDAAKLQVYRVITLGITGFDAPIAENSMQESAYSLAGLRDIVDLYRDDTKQSFDNAIQYLSGGSSFDEFNRAAFITQYANPLTTGLTQLQHDLHIQPMHYSRLLRQDAKTLFDSTAFDVTAYAPGTTYQQSPQQIALGEKLFFDPVLSGTQTRSCASCHNPSKAFSDGLIKNTVVNGSALVARNTPTLINAALQPFQFYDMRVFTLEEQVTDVVQNKQEMGGCFDTVVNRLWQSKMYRKLFSEAFPQTGRTAIDTSEITHAIAEYVRSLTRLNSRFDDYMRGNQSAMNAQEIHGLNIFMGKAKCGTCHYMPLFNGALPPAYTQDEPEVIGVPALANRNMPDSDVGRYAIMNVSFYKHAFKTPTLRNAALTAPYMHNGVFNTLDEVIDFYDNGGGSGEGLHIDNQTLPVNKLNLTSAEKHDLIAFIQCLNSR